MPLGMAGLSVGGNSGSGGVIDRWTGSGKKWKDLKGGEKVARATVQSSRTAFIAGGQLIEGKTMKNLTEERMRKRGQDSDEVIARRMAAARDEMAHHEEPQIAAHMLAGVPHGTYVECFADPARDPFWPHMLVDPPAIRDGMLEVPDRPGFGITLDWDRLAQFRIA